MDEFLDILQLVAANEELRIENDSTQAVIHSNELVTYIRQYPILYSETLMSQVKSLVLSYQVEATNISVPNYRKLIIDELDDLLSKKIQILNTNSYLIQQVDKMSTDLSHPRRFSFLPTYIMK